MAKWIQVEPNYYKYVDDSDPRPKVEPPKRKIGDTYLKFTPSWKKYEQKFSDLDPEKKSDLRKTDAFIDEREHETRTDPRARRWEESRKKEWARNKPAWRKKMMNEGLIT